MSADKSKKTPDKRRKYDDAFKAEALRLAAERRSTQAALEGVPMATIYAQDTTVIGTTDREGSFKLDVSVDTHTLLFAFVGMERTIVNLSGECPIVEVILLYSVSYDFRSVRYVNRKRFKRFKRLPQLRQQAYEKVLFKSRAPCASPILTKWVPHPTK